MNRERGSKRHHEICLSRSFTGPLKGERSRLCPKLMVAGLRYPPHSQSGGWR